jgi:osmotically-inducible protein OsmY
MYRTASLFFVGAALLSLTLAHAENKFPTPSNRSLGITAEQQSNDEADVEITRKIRQAVVKDDSLSFYAQNVKIITIDGLVTLKGPVRHASEKQKVEQIAESIAGKDQVLSEITLPR